MMNVSDSLFQHFLEMENKNINTTIGDMIGGVNVNVLGVLVTNMGVSLVVLVVVLVVVFV
jgi:hypothetical protein